MRKAQYFERGVRASYIVLVATLLVPVFSLLQAFHAVSERDRLVDVATAAVRRAIRIEADVNRLAADARAYALTGSPSSVPAHGTATLLDAVATLRGEPLSEPTERLVDSLERAIVDYGGARDHSIDLRSAAVGVPSAELVAQFENEVLPRQRAIADTLGAYVIAREEQLGPLTAAAESAFYQALLLSLAAVLVALLVSTTLGVYSARKLVLLYTAEQTASQRAAEAVDARDEVLRVVAHDLRSPLAAISLKAAQIGRMAEGKPARQAGSIETIVRRMDAMIQSLLETHLIRHGKFDVSLRTEDVREILAAAHETFEAQAAARSISLAVEVAGEGLRVHADRNRVVEVLGNILENALKFTPNGGAVILRAAPEGEAIRLSVSDSGPGMDAADLPHVFERFWKTQRAGGGTGLGLYIAREIVLAHGGRIWAESSPGRGATFSFTLKRAT